MKKPNLILLISALSVVVFFLVRTWAAEPTTFQVVEFATIRWGGRDNSVVIRPSGKIEKLKPLFEQYKRPDGIDDRVFYMAIAMNTIAREGYDFAGMTHDEIVMKRPVAR